MSDENKFIAHEIGRRSAKLISEKCNHDKSALVIKSFGAEMRDDTDELWEREILPGLTMLINELPKNIYCVQMHKNRYGVQEVVELTDGIKVCVGVVYSDRLFRDIIQVSIAYIDLDKPRDQELTCKTSIK